MVCSCAVTVDPIGTKDFCLTYVHTTGEYGDLEPVVHLLVLTGLSLPPDRVKEYDALKEISEKTEDDACNKVHETTNKKGVIPHGAVVVPVCTLKVTSCDEDMASFALVHTDG